MFEVSGWYWISALHQQNFGSTVAPALHTPPDSEIRYCVPLSKLCNRLFVQSYYFTRLSYNVNHIPRRILSSPLHPDIWERMIAASDDKSISDVSALRRTPGNDYYCVQLFWKRVPFRLSFCLVVQQCVCVVWWNQLNILLLTESGGWSYTTFHTYFQPIF